MTDRVEKINRAIIKLLEAKGVDIGMEPDFTTQAKAIGGGFLLDKRSVSGLPERRASGAGLWSPEDVDNEISSALTQLGNGLDRLSNLEPEIYILLKLKPDRLDDIRKFISETRQRSKTVRQTVFKGVNPKRLANVDLVALMGSALNGAIWAQVECGVEDIKVPRKLTGKPWIEYFKSVALIMDVSFDNHERNYATMMKSRQALASARREAK